MCTITYLPLDNNSYILTQNRDVSTDRDNAEPPAFHQVSGKKLIYPTDPQGGGTWNALSETQQAFVLNGADYDYSPDFDAERSRGELCITLLTQKDEILNSLDLRKYDHFTLYSLDTTDKSNPIQEWSWNGEELKKQEFSAEKPQFWISKGLYTPEDFERKRDAFQEWKQIESFEDRNQSIEMFAENIWSWQSQKIVKDDEGFVIDRPYGVATVSMYQVVKTGNSFMFRYKDILEERVHTFVDVEF